MKTMVNSKAILAGGLLPAAQLVERCSGACQRLWAFSRLRTMLPSVDVSVVIMGVPELHGTRAIRLGRNLYLYRELYLETQGIGVIRIEDDVVLSRGVHLVAYAELRIGAGSMIGEYTSIRDANHLFGDGVRLRDSGHAAQAVDIGCNVWIGRGVTVLPGVKIGDGAVIGANAVVTSDVPAGSVVGGVPARPIRRGQS